MPILVNLDVILAKRKKSLRDLAAATHITLANLSRMKNGHSQGIRFTPLDKICTALECAPSDIFQQVTEDEYLKLMGRLPAYITHDLEDDN